ncbi:hypothetical protein NMY22_g18457 [Coprinellus aureogranulatus]|nr:hypothetical protein NMY22_g18457 [Coprinellus aureogranulatus]
MQQASAILGTVERLESELCFAMPSGLFPSWPTGLCTAALMLRSCVTSLFDITSSVLVAYSVYYYLIPEFGSFERFKAVTPQFSAECLISALITFISQLYFVHQLVVVKRSGKGSWIIIGLILSFSVLAAIGGIGCVSSMYVWDTAVLAFRNKTFTTTLVDASPHIRTQTLVSQVVVFVIQRGILVTTIQAAVLIAFFAAPSNLAWLALHMNVTRLYANTFFAMLNGRSNLRDKHNGTIVSNFNLLRAEGKLRPIIAQKISI